jgi:hypothetical protein
VAVTEMEIRGFRIREGPMEPNKDQNGRCGQAPAKVQWRPQMAPKTAKPPDKSKTVVHPNGRAGAVFGPSLPSSGAAVGFLAPVTTTGATPVIAT